MATEKGNVLVIGNSGVGKSTLINAVLGEAVAKTGWRARGTTAKLEIYESDEIQFRVVDTIGFEPSWRERTKAVNAVKKWSKEGVKKNSEDRQINVIWFCVDGTAKKLFPSTIDAFAKATEMWSSVPVIMVITKSYASGNERTENIQMVREAIERNARLKEKNPRILPVVASRFPINDTMAVEPEGIPELIDLTNELMPEGKRAADNDIAKFKLNRTRAMAHGSVAAAVLAAVVKGFLPGKLVGSVALKYMITAEIEGLARIYGLNKKPENDAFAKKYITWVDESAIDDAVVVAAEVIKKIPGADKLAAATDGIAAGCIVAGIYETTLYVFEQIYLGKKSVDDFEWVKKLYSKEWKNVFGKKVGGVMEQSSGAVDKAKIAQLILQWFKIGGTPKN